MLKSLFSWRTDNGRVYVSEEYGDYWKVIELQEKGFIHTHLESIEGVVSEGCWYPFTDKGLRLYNHE